MTRPPSGESAPQGRPAPGGGRRAMFLQRRTYRRRRLMDAARILPLVGAVMFTIPLLWPEADGPAGTSIPTSLAITYIFATWALLIGASAVFSYFIQSWSEVWDPDSDPPSQSAPVPDSADGQAG